MNTIEMYSRESKNYSFKRFLFLSSTIDIGTRVCVYTFLK